jgi:hypothetical protein
VSVTGCDTAATITLYTCCEQVERDPTKRERKKGPEVSNLLECFAVPIGKYQMNFLSI